MNVLVIGSAPDSIQVNNRDIRIFDRVIVINNAWKVTSHWDELIFPHDFSDENKPHKLLNHQK